MLLSEFCLKKVSWNFLGMCYKPFFVLFSAPFQYVGIPISFLSLAYSSSKMFYSQRLGQFADVDPGLKNVFTIFPIVVFQITGPLFSLVLMAAYLKPYIFVCILFIILVNFIALETFVFGWTKPTNNDLSELYKRSK